MNFGTNSANPGPTSEQKQRIREVIGVETLVGTASPIQIVGRRQINTVTVGTGVISVQGQSAKFEELLITANAAVTTGGNLMIEFSSHWGFFTVNVALTTGWSGNTVAAAIRSAFAAHTALMVSFDVLGSGPEATLKAKTALTVGTEPAMVLTLQSSLVIPSLTWEVMEEGRSYTPGQVRLKADAPSIPGGEVEVLIPATAGWSATTTATNLVSAWNLDADCSAYATASNTGALIRLEKVDQEENEAMGILVSGLYTNGPSFVHSYINIQSGITPYAGVVPQSVGQMYRMGASAPYIWYMASSVSALGWTLVFPIGSTIPINGVAGVKQKQVWNLFGGAIAGGGGGTITVRTVSAATGTMDIVASVSGGYTADMWLGSYLSQFNSANSFYTVTLTGADDEDGYLLTIERDVFAANDPTLSVTVLSSTATGADPVDLTTFLTNPVKTDGVAQVLATPPAPPIHVAGGYLYIQEAGTWKKASLLDLSMGGELTSNLFPENGVPASMLVSGSLTSNGSTVVTFPELKRAGTNNGRGFFTENGRLTGNGKFCSWDSTNERWVLSSFFQTATWYCYDDVDYPWDGTTWISSGAATGVPVVIQGEEEEMGTVPGYKGQIMRVTRSVLGQSGREFEFKAENVSPAIWVSNQSDIIRDPDTGVWYEQYVDVVADVDRLLVSGITFAAGNTGPYLTKHTSQLNGRDRFGSPSSLITNLYWTGTKYYLDNVSQEWESAGGEASPWEVLTWTQVAGSAVSPPIVTRALIAGGPTIKIVALA